MFRFKDYLNILVDYGQVMSLPTFTNGAVCFVHEMAKRLKVHEGKLIMLRGTLQNIAERKIAKEAWRRSQQVIEGII